MDTPRQVGALPIRKRNKQALEVLLVTSRETRRWVIPKGWPSKRMSDRKAALREAEEEAGVSGPIAKKPLGRYTYFKRDPDGFRLIDVAVYLLEVDKEYQSWAEENDRTRCWMSVEKAASAVLEPGLRTLIAALANLPTGKRDSSLSMPGHKRKLKQPAEADNKVAKKVGRKSSKKDAKRTRKLLARVEGRSTPATRANGAKASASRRG